MSTYTQIQTINTKIFNLEVSLNKFMDLDMSDSSVRAAARKVTNKISVLEDKKCEVLKSYEA